MKTSTEINSNVKDTLLAVKTINTVEVSPFFKERVLQQIFNIPEEKAVTALIDLIKEHGDWVEKK